MPLILRKGEGHRRGAREDELVPSFTTVQFDTRRQVALENELMDAVHQMGTPVAEATVAEVKPATPFAAHIFVGIVMELGRCQPAVPVKCLWHIHRVRIAEYIAAILMPPAWIVHVNDDALNILHNPLLNILLELVVLFRRVSLVAHLRDDTIFLGGGHQQ